MLTPTQTLLSIVANQHFEGFGEGLLKASIAGPVALVIGLFVLFQ